MSIMYDYTALYLLQSSPPMGVPKGPSAELSLGLLVAAEADESS